MVHSASNKAVWGLCVALLSAGSMEATAQELVPVASKGKKKALDVPPPRATKEYAAHLTGKDAPRDQDVVAYLPEGLPFVQRAVHGRVWEKFWPAYVLMSLTVPVGGLLWVPLLFFRDVPDHPAQKKARILAAIGTGINLGGAVAFLLPLALGWLVFIPVYGWIVLAWLLLVALGITAWWSMVSFIPVMAVFPKMVMLATSDAYALGQWKPEEKPPAP